MEAVMTREALAIELGKTGQGDRAAFQRVYEATSSKLLGVCLRILGDRGLAEDVLQDTYLTVWRRAETFDATRASPITWLVTIARNRAIDRLRSAGARVQTRPVDDAFEVEDAAPLASEQIESADEARRLNGCLEELDDKVGGAIRTAFFEGVTYDELSRREAVPLGTMKSWIRRGLLKLRACLEQ